jgi:hypothetical protein
MTLAKLARNGDLFPDRAEPAGIDAKSGMLGVRNEQVAIPFFLPTTGEYDMNTPKFSLVTEIDDSGNAANDTNPSSSVPRSILSVVTVVSFAVVFASVFVFLATLGSGQIAPMFASAAAVFVFSIVGVSSAGLRSGLLS